MKNQSISPDIPLRSVCPRPEFRGNLFLGLLLGVHLVLSLPQSHTCAYTQSYSPKGTAAQASHAC